MMLDLRLAMVGRSFHTRDPIPCLKFPGSAGLNGSVGLEAALNRCKWREIKCVAAEVEDARSMEYKDAGARDIH